jgi:hypothetical protein
MVLDLVKSGTQTVGFHLGYTWAGYVHESNREVDIRMDQGWVVIVEEIGQGIPIRGFEFRNLNRTPVTPCFNISKKISH